MRSLIIVLLFFSGYGSVYADSQGTDRVIENPVSNGDLYLQINDGGVKKKPLKIEGSSGDVVFDSGVSGAAVRYDSANQSLLVTGDGNANSLITVDGAGTAPRMSLKKNGTEVLGVSDTGQLNAKNTVTVSSVSPVLKLYETDGGADEKAWEMTVNAGTFVIRAKTDADAPRVTPFAIGANGTSVFASSTVAPLQIQNTNTTITSSTVGLQVGLNGASDVSTAHYIRFRDADTTITGAIVGASATTVAYNTSSDERLKEKFVPLSGGIEKIKAGEPSCSNWKQGGHLDCGFSAQKMKKIYPYAVTGTPDGDEETEPMMIDYGRLTPVLWAAIKEQQAIIDQLKSRIEVLESK